MDSEIQRMKKEMVENTTDVQYLLSMFNEEADDNAPEDQRSRRKRVDALLKAISERPGQLRFNGSAVVSLQSMMEIPEKNTSGVGSFDLFAHTSFGQNTLLFFDFEAVMGNGPTPANASFTSLNGDAGSTQSLDGFDRVHLLEAWAEFTLFKESMTVNIGKIDLTNYFDNNRIANDETSQFLGSSFVNSAALAVPAGGPGVRVRTEVLNRFFLQGGLSTMENTGDNLLAQPFKIGSMGMRFFPTTEWEANIRVYGYQHPGIKGAAGWGVSFDETLGKSIEIFLRFGKNNANLADYCGIGNAWSGGFSWLSKLADRKFKVGAAIGNINTGETALKSEMNLEIYARHQLNRWSYFSAHYQFQSNSAISENASGFLGCRINFNF